MSSTNEKTRGEGLNIQTMPDSLVSKRIISTTTSIYIPARVVKITPSLIV